MCISPVPPGDQHQMEKWLKVILCEMAEKKKRGSRHFLRESTLRVLSNVGYTRQEKMMIQSIMLNFYYRKKEIKVAERNSISWRHGIEVAELF